MIDAIKEFWSDYIDLCNHSTFFTRKHWKGIVIAYAVIYLIMFAVAYDWPGKLLSKFRKEEKSTEAPVEEQARKHYFRMPASAFEREDDI